MITKKISLIVIFAIYFTFMGLWGNGCSSADRQSPDPISPQISEHGSKILNENKPSTFPLAFADSLPNGGTTGIGVLGVFDISIDTVNLTADILSIRENSAIGDSFVVDITNFLTISPCTNCLSIESIELNLSDNLVITFAIRHPFEHGTFDKPPSASNRLDLHIFDVFGVIHFPGTLINFPLLENSISPVMLVNADGFTGQFDSRIDAFFPTEGTIHPYKVMSLDPTQGNFNPNNMYGFDPINAPTGHNVLMMGGAKSARFEIDFSDTAFVNFLMVITSSYGQSANAITRLQPQYYMPEFNRKEAWKVSVNAVQNNLFEGDTLSYCDLGIDIWDWNHGITVDPTLSTKDVIRAASNVQSVEVEIPGVLLTTVTGAGPTSGDGRSTPLHFTARVYNQTGGSSGIRYGLIKVLDTRLPGGNKNGIGDGVDRDGVTFFQLTEFATYQLFTVEIHRAEPICVITTDPSPPIIHPGETISLDGSSSYDFDGQITSYEWDYDYNGSVFNIDATGAVPSPPPPIFDNNHNFENKTVTIALRVIDNNSPAPYSTICTVDLIVKPNRQPIADFTSSINPPIIKRGDQITFDASPSSDPDGDTLTYEWDFDYRGNVFTAETTGVLVDHTFNERLCGLVALRVSDEGIPNPRTNIRTMPVTVLPKFDPLFEKRIDNTMGTRSAIHDTYSCVVATDPNTKDIYIAYNGVVGSTNRIRVQRSYDGGQTWSTPIDVNYATNQSGVRGIALVVVPDETPGNVYAFWIGDGGNNSYGPSDGWNVRFNKGEPVADSFDMWWDVNWHQDITLYSLSDGASWNAPNEYCLNYYIYSQPLYLAAVADPIAIGTVYVAYSETSSNATYCGESVRLVKTTDIQNYPSSTWAPMTKTNHVESATGDVPDFTGIDLAIDSSRNVYVVWDNNINGEIKIRKYPFGLTPGNSIQIVDTNPDTSALYNPRMAINNDNRPVVVYNHKNFPGGVDGVPDIVLNYAIDDVPTMGFPIRVNSSASVSTVKQNPDIAIDKECGNIFIVYEDRRDNASYGEIYWTIMDDQFNVIQTDEAVNTLDLTHSLADFDVHFGLSQNSNGFSIIATWEQTGEDTRASMAY